MTTSNILLARQPIHDRDLRIAGYELLFRAAGADHAEIDSPERSTADVITRALLDIGLDALIGPSRAWLNVSRDFLVQRVFEALPPERVVLEVLESVQAEPEVLEALRAARAKGFRIALDDFELSSENAELVALCDLIKIDCCGRTPEELALIASGLAPSGRRLLAEKVETREVFEACRAAGYELFQGYFFTRPSAVRGAEVKGDRVRLMRLVAELNDAGTSMERIVELVQADVSLSYRLMRYVNSAVIGRPAQITSLRDAISMLGLDRVRACVTLLMLGSMSDKPLELATTALVRARYCQLLGGTRAGDPHKHFVVGLFSVLDAYLDEPMASVMYRLTLSGDVVRALVDHKGELGEVLEAALACEQADWDGRVIAKFDECDVSASYLAAIDWANQTQASLSES